MPNMEEGNPSLKRRFKSLRNPGYKRDKSTDRAPKEKENNMKKFNGWIVSLHPEKRKEQEQKQEQEAKVPSERLRRAEEFAAKQRQMNALKEKLDGTDNKDIKNMPTEVMQDFLYCAQAGGDPEKAFQFILFQHKSNAGWIAKYDPSIHMLGAENLKNVTCYIDTVLFAMFARVEAYEIMLQTRFDDPEKQELADLIRLWVNMLRTGRLITLDITARLRESMKKCGWKQDAFDEIERQQDVSEAFCFLTDTLGLPLLQFKVDLYHQGKGDVDDHKEVSERLLDLSVPADPEGKEVDLADCLEEYFNSRVEVLRDTFDDQKPHDRPILSVENTIRLVSTQEEGDPGSAAETPVDQLTASPGPYEPQSSFTTSTGEESTRQSRRRTGSVLQKVVLDENGIPIKQSDETLFQRAKRKGSTIVRAITIPAWQFYTLIPWHNIPQKQLQNDFEVREQLSERPVVGICLKRAQYVDGVIKKHNTPVDIPESMRLPHFMMRDERPVVQAVSQDYKLELQSVICHRGEHMETGHYVCYARIEPKLLTENRRYSDNPPPDYELAQWVKFDDLHLADRVVVVDDLKEALKVEMPYLLFYQIVPVVEVGRISTDEASATEPPSYIESASMFGNGSTIKSQSTANVTEVSRLSAEYFPNMPLPGDRQLSSRSGTTEGRQSTMLSRRGSTNTDPTAVNSTAVSSAVNSAAATPVTGIPPVLTPGASTPAEVIATSAANSAVDTPAASLPALALGVITPADGSTPLVTPSSEEPPNSKLKSMVAKVMVQQQQLQYPNSSGGTFKTKPERKSFMEMMLPKSSKDLLAKQSTSDESAPSSPAQEHPADGENHRLSFTGRRNKGKERAKSKPRRDKSRDRERELAKGKRFQEKECVVM